MKKTFWAIILLAFVAFLVTVPVAIAQDEAVENGLLSEETKTTLYVAGAWLLYSILGMLASLTAPDGKFDTQKFLKSLAYAIVVALIAIGLGVHPTSVETEYANLVTEVVNFLMNTGAFITLIYSADKGVTAISNIVNKLKEAAKPAEP